MLRYHISKLLARCASARFQCDVITVALERSRYADDTCTVEELYGDTAFRMVDPINHADAKANAERRMQTTP